MGVDRVEVVRGGNSSSEGDMGRAFRLWRSLDPANRPRTICAKAALAGVPNVSVKLFLPGS